MPKCHRIIIRIERDIDLLFRLTETIRSDLLETWFLRRIVDLVRICPIMEIEVNRERDRIFVPDFE